MAKVKLIKKIIFIVMSVVVGGLVALAVIPGFDFLMVRSGSMTGTFNVGDVVVIGPVNSLPGTELKPGTVITFWATKDELVTHRIVEAVGNNFRTKGDVNEEADAALVIPSNIKGAYLFRIPYIGYVTSFIQTKNGWFLSILIPAGILVGLLVKDILKEAFRDDSKKKEGQTCEEGNYPVKEGSHKV